jgi:hypothetical protein
MGGVDSEPETAGGKIAFKFAWTTTDEMVADFMILLLWGGSIYGWGWITRFDPELLLYPGWIIITVVYVVLYALGMSYRRRRRG